MKLSTDLINHRYRIIRPLSQSHSSSVFLADDTVQRRQVVLKKFSVSADNNFIPKLIALHRLKHPNICEMLDVMLYQGEKYFIHSYAPGPNFLTWASFDRDPVRICLGGAAFLRALQYLHAVHLIHGTLRPDSIRVDTGEISALPAVRMIDLEHIIADIHLLPVSSLAYAAPEILAGDPADYSSDIYSFGAILFEALFNRLPNPQFSPLTSEITIPASYLNSPLAELIKSLLSPIATQRPSFSDIWEILSHLTHRDLRLDINELKTLYWPMPTPLFGRELQLNRIHEVILQTTRGLTRAIHLWGYGKSTMVEEIYYLAKLHGLEVISINEQLSKLPDRPNDGASVTNVQQLAAQCSAELLNKARSSPLLLSFDGCPANDPLIQLILRQLFLSIIHCEAQGTLLLWIGELPEDLAEGWDSIPLPGLTPEQVKDLVQFMLYAVNPSWWQEQIFHVTAGDPGLVVNLLSARIEAGFPDEPYISSEPAKLLETRLTALTPSERRLLVAIAHTPHPVSFSVLSQVMPEDTDALTVLGHKGYVSQNSQGYFPANLLLRQAAQALLVGKSLVQLHQRFCEVLQAEAQPNLKVLGHHLLWAGYIRQGAEMLLQTIWPPVEDLERAATLLPGDDKILVEVWRYLARIARARGDFQRALFIADTLQREHTEAGILLRAEILLDAGQPHSVLQALKQISRTNMLTMLLTARAHFLTGDYNLVLTEVASARTASDGDSRLLLQLEHLAGLSLVFSGRLSEGVEVLKKLIQQAHDLDHQEMLARIHNSRGIALQRLGQWDEAEQAYLTALNIVENIGELSFAANYLQNLGILAQHHLKLESALLYYRNANQLAQRCNIGAIRAAALANEANLLLLIGAMDEARDRLEQAELLARKTGANNQLGHIHLYWAEYWLSQNRTITAEERILRAQECFSPSNQLAHTAISIMKAELALRKKDFSLGKKLLNELIKALPGDNPEGWRIHLLLAQFALIEKPPQLEPAIRELELCLALAGYLQSPERIWEAQAWLAHCYQQRGMEEAAIFYASCCQQALAAFRRQIPLNYRGNFDQRPEVKQAMERAAAIWDAKPQTSPSLKDLKQLLEINQVLNCQLPLEILLKRILSAALDLTGAERGYALLKGDNGTLKIMAAYDGDTDYVHDEISRLSEQVALMAMTEKRTITAADMPEEWKNKNSVNLNEWYLRAVLCVPLRIQREAGGALYLDQRYSPQAFQPKHLYLAEALAKQAGIAIETSWLLAQETEKRIALANAKSDLEVINQQLAGQVTQQSNQLQTISELLRANEAQLIRRYNEAKIIGRSKVMQELFLKMDRIGESDLPVLIVGESGTGKELIAQAIHYTSTRQNEPFIAINCTALPPMLIESELFGHKKGAFTGALQDRPGFFEVAGKGTLLLDEIGDMPLDMQTKLLRVLQEGKYRRVGDDQEREAHCRVISATNKCLDDLVAQKKFRTDLYYRLNVFNIQVPPLRQRREDIPLLVEHFLSTISKPVTLSHQAMAVLLDYDWPGNVRQLQNEILRTSFLCEGTIEANSFSTAITSTEQPYKKSLTLHEAVQEATRDFERKFIEYILDEVNYNVSAAAKRLGLTRVWLHKKMRSLNINRKKIN